MDSVKSVLIIDDDEDDLFLIEDRLSQIVESGCEFVSCSLRHEAITLLKERTFDLCILDYRLAGYEGIEILEAVSEAELATPIIMLTGQDDNEVAKQAIKSGAQDFVMKSSIDEEIFEKSVQYAIARKELEFARVLSKRNEAENTAKDKFIAHLSHELRTPLTSILGYTSLLLEKESTSEFHNELGVISNNGKHLLNLLNDVLDLSKIAADKFELKISPTDLQELLIDVNSLLSVNAVDKGLYLEFSADTPLPVNIELDGVRFKQVMVNVIGNAIKFTDKGGIRVTLELEEFKQDIAGSSAPTYQLNIYIQDTGIGMEKKEIEQIFAPFTQIEDVTNRKAGGAGLGLSITAEIVKQMQGTLEVESVMGKGSLFTLSFPCKPTSSETAVYEFNRQYRSKKASIIPSLNGHVLIVDDVFEIRQLAGYFVKETGVKVTFASNGEQALAKVKEASETGTPVELILMDLHMPALTGSETVRALRAQGNTCHIIAMTAAINKGLFDELKKDGFDQLISKPLDKIELWGLLEKALIEESIAGDHNGSPVVHLIEDDEDSATIMTLMIEQLGFKVVQSFTGEQAISQAHSNTNIALHLLDLGLPDVSGDTLVEQFFAKPVKGNVIILSGNQPDPAILQQHQICDHLIKPIDKEILKNCLAHYA